ncbi:VOC family protein [Brevibacterium metallidurans]|uniref:VOC domain-containing protein n=1 Tax=Brevibacterium metallidurans TaxID=1482676 RepID=A0ABN0ST74_9MICO
MTTTPEPSTTETTTTAPTATEPSTTAPTATGAATTASANPDSAPTQANVWPTFRYRDAKAAITFLTSAFGFEVAVEYTNADDPTVVEHAELAWPGGGGIMLGSARDDGGVMTSVGVASGSVYIAVDDVDSLFRRATDAGASVVRGLTEMDYGSCDFSVTDPEGVLWNFGTYRGAGRA